MIKWDLTAGTDDRSSGRSVVDRQQDEATDGVRVAQGKLQRYEGSQD